jgi:Transposase DDE domain
MRKALQSELFGLKAEVLRCPVGETPVEQQVTNPNGKTVRLAIFAGARCVGCPLRGQCPTEKRGDETRVLRYTAADVAVARRRIEQETPEFKERHKIRSGIEATHSELKRCHRLGKLRVRRKARVSLSVRLKVLALNIKRYVKHLVGVVAPSSAALACNC